MKGARRVLFDMDVKEIWVDGDFSFWPNPHMRMVRMNEKGVEGIFECVHCGSRDLNSCCTAEPEPCVYCGLRGICAPDCTGILSLLGSDSVYLAGVIDPEAPVN